MRPSARNTTRSAKVAADGSWVTMTIVWPRSSTARRIRSRISRLETESRLPVGSSPNTTAGRVIERARDGDALLLAAGQLRRAVRAAIAEADRVDQRVEPIAIDARRRRCAAAG